MTSKKLLVARWLNARVLALVAACASMASCDTKVETRGSPIPQDRMTMNGRYSPWLDLEPWKIAALSDGTIYIARNWHNATALPNGESTEGQVLRIDPNGDVIHLDIASSDVVRDSHDHVFLLVRDGILEIDHKGRRSMLLNYQPGGTSSAASGGKAAGAASDARELGQLMIDAHGKLYLQRGRAPNVDVVAIDANGRMGSPLIASGIGTVPTVDAYLKHATAVDSQGAIYSGGWNVITKVSPDGQVTPFVGDESQKAVDISFGNERGLTDSFYRVNELSIDGNDNLYTSLRCHLLKISPDGKAHRLAMPHHDTAGITDPAEPPACPSATLDVRDDGTMTFYDTANNAIRRLRPDGTMRTIVWSDFIDRRNRSPLPATGWR